MSKRLFSLLILLVAMTHVHADEAESLIAPGAKVQKLTGDMKFTEGPAWIPAKKILVFSDIPNSRIMQWKEGEGVSLFRASEQSNGNILDLEGRLISCQHAARNVVRTEADGSITVLADKYDGKRLNSPNDVAVKSDGTLYFTDPPWGLTGPAEISGHWVYRLDPATGKVEPIVKDLAMPNGINFFSGRKPDLHRRHRWQFAASRSGLPQTACRNSLLRGTQRRIARQEVIHDRRRQRRHDSRYSGQPLHNSRRRQHLQRRRQAAGTNPSPRRPGQRNFRRR